MEKSLFINQLQGRSPGLMESRGRSEVLLGFVPENGGWSLVLEERAHSLHFQPGEICLPGGRVEPGEAPGQAAVRETCEELCLAPGQVELWGASDRLLTQGRQLICPYFGQLKDYAGSFSADEVHSVFTVPVRWLLDHPPVRCDTAVRTCPGEDFPYERIPGGRDYPWPPGRWAVYFYEYGDRQIWGITAKLIYHSMELIRSLGGLPPLP